MILRHGWAKCKIARRGDVFSCIPTQGMVNICLGMAKWLVTSSL